MPSFRITPSGDFTQEQLDQLAKCLQPMLLTPEITFIVEYPNEFSGSNPMQAICDHASRLNWLMANMRKGSIINLGNGIVIRPGEDIATWVEKIDSAKEE